MAGLPTLAVPPFSQGKVPMSHRLRSSLLIIMAAGVLVAACSSSSGTTSVDMTGTWRVSGTDYREFNDDGSYRIGLTEGMENAVVDQGDYSVEGDVLHHSSNADSAVCADGDTATFTIESLEDGTAGEERMLLVQRDDECARRDAEVTSFWFG
jgi:hypothetical protein